jgi:excisionase family DNA binding protein
VTSDTGGSIMNTPIAVTIPEAVKATGMSRTSIYEALKRGDLTARKAGRRTLIAFADLQAYLASLPAYRTGA